MEQSDVAVIGVTLAGFGIIIYGIAVNLVRLVGVGAIIGVLFNLVKMLNDRSADRRRRKDEGIQRLLPVVYRPLFS